MSDTNDAASKTEEPTSRKLQQARERGDVVKTPDLSSLASLVAAASVVILCGGMFSRKLIGELTPFLAHPEAFSLQGGGGVGVARMAIMAALPVLASVMFAAGAAGAAANILQTGLIFSPDKLAPDFSKLSPLAGLKRIYSIDGFMQFLKSLSKVAVTGWLVWWVIKPHLSELEELTRMEPAATLTFTIDIMKRLFFSVTTLLLVIAGADWMWQRQRFMTKMRMTKEEVKDDFKQTEGDPHIKGRQRKIRMERARRRMMKAVPTATVVVMNPTHYAVALKYDAGETPAPLCVAKGLDSLALKIRAVAEEAGVPIIEDPPLARALYATVEIDDIIPPAHYEAVAKIIGFILNAGRRVQARAL
jgi:flagellar biosynthetic protein FlhB